MLVRVHEVVVGGVVEEEESEPDGEPAQRGAPPAELRVRCPSEDKEAHRHEPAGAHHRYEARFGGRFAGGGSRADAKVVLVDEGRAGGAEEDAEGEGDEH